MKRFYYCYSLFTCSNCGEEIDPSLPNQVLSSLHNQHYIAAESVLYVYRIAGIPGGGNIFVEFNTLANSWTKFRGIMQ